jgi:hypothetical protein
MEFEAIEESEASESETSREKSLLFTSSDPPFQPIASVLDDLQLAPVGFTRDSCGGRTQYNRLYNECLFRGTGHPRFYRDQIVPLSDDNSVNVPAESRTYCGESQETEFVGAIPIDYGLSSQILHHFSTRQTLRNQLNEAACFIDRMKIQTKALLVQQCP